MKSEVGARAVAYLLVAIIMLVTGYRIYTGVDVDKGKDKGNEVTEEVKAENIGIKAQAYIVDTSVTGVPGMTTIPMGTTVDGGWVKDNIVRLYLLKDDYYVNVTDRMREELTDVEYLEVVVYKDRIIAGNVEILREEGKTEPEIGEGIPTEALVIDKREENMETKEIMYFVRLYALKGDYDVQVSREQYGKLNASDKINVTINKGNVVIN